MRFESEVIVTGMKANKGTMDNGTSYDSTKVFVQTDLDTSRGNAAGFATSEYSFGNAGFFERFRNMAYPFKARAIFEMVTTGKVQKTVLVDLHASVKAPA